MAARRNWREVGYEPAELAEAGDRVCVSFVSRADGPRAKPFFQVYTFKEGRIVRMQDFAKRGNALRAAGISG